MARRRHDSRSASVTSSHPRFGEQLNSNGVIFDRSCVEPPKDLDELMEHLNRQRDSKSPSECEYRAYVTAVDTSFNEDTMTRSLDWISKNQTNQDRPESRRYVRAYNLQFTDTAAPTQNGISNPQPDIMETFTTAAYPRQALEELAGVLTPTKHPLAMPGFTVQVKGPNGRMDAAMKQCAYGMLLQSPYLLVRSKKANLRTTDGSVMVHSAHKIHQHLGNPSTAFYGRTQAISVAFNGTDLCLYANYLSKEGSYYLYPISAEKPCFSFTQFQSARRHLRNVQDWSRRKSEQRCNQLWDKERQKAVTRRKYKCRVLASPAEKVCAPCSRRERQR
jgi:hypothetical protein